MKTYQKAELIAKNLPTGSYAAGCPTNSGYRKERILIWQEEIRECRPCELNQ